MFNHQEIEPYEYDPPLLFHLQNYGSSGLQKGINGMEIFQRLNQKYQSILDLLPNSNDDLAIIDPTSDRLDLTHSILKSFILNDFQLSQFGIKEKSRIGVLVPNGAELATILIALVSRWCAAPINPNITSSEIKIELESMKCQSIIIFSGFSNNPAIIEVAKSLNLTIITLHPSVSVTGLFSLELSFSPIVITPLSTRDSSYNNSHHTVLLLHTSGTGGKKKLVAYTLDMLIIGVGCIVSSWNLSPDDCCLNMMPLFHIGGIVRNIFSPILSGGSVITCNAFDPVLFWDVLMTKRFTWYYAAPTMHHAILLEASQRISSIPPNSTEKSQFNLKLIVKPVRFIANAAGGLLPALAESLKKVFQTTILTSYGMTECMPISSPPQDYDLQPPGTSGTPVGPSILIVDDDMQTTLPHGRAGHIMIKGLPCFQGYETADSSLDRESFYSINGDPDWFCTGDCGYLDQTGFLFISGRSKEIINRGGETISPFEIEEAMLSHPSIQEVMCFSSPHNHFQETVGAVVVIKKDSFRPDLPHLHKFLEKSLHRSKWPQIVVYMAQLPKNAAGKLLRVKFSDRAKLPSIDDDMSPLERLYEGTCPAVGTPLTTFIEVHPIQINIQLIESFLQKIPGVETAAAVILNLPSQRDSIVAFVTPATVNVSSIQLECEKSLHSYLCPVMIHATDTSFNIPVLTGENGISQRDDEALIAQALDIFTSQTVQLPQTDVEIELERIWREQLQYTRPLSITMSFFELGGDSLKAGSLVSAIRRRFSISITVADLFTSPTIEKLAQQITYLLALETDSAIGSEVVSSDHTSPQGRDSVEYHSRSPDANDMELGLNSKIDLQNWEYSMKLSNTSWGCLITQLLPLCLFFPVRRLSMWFLIAGPWVALMNAGLDRFPALIVAMILMRIISGIFFPLFGILCKWLIIGQYRAGRYPLWGVMYLKWWLVEQILRIMGKGIFHEGTPLIGTFLVRFYYVLLGASIGKNVKINSKAQLGQADLLVIGDDVIIDDAIVLPFSVEEGHMILLPIVIGDRCSVGVKSVIAAGSVLLSGTHIGPLSSSHEKEDSNPQNIQYCRPGFPSPPWYLIIFVGFPILICVAMVSYIPWVIGLQMMVNDAKLTGWYQDEINSIYDAFLWWITPRRMIYYFILRIIHRCIIPFVRLFIILLIKWSVIGEFRPMNTAERLRSWNLFRYWLMKQLLPGGDLGGVANLVGTHYEVISIIYRLLGAKIGQRVYWPGSGLDVIEYDLLEIGNDVVFGSRSILFTSSSTISKRIIISDGCMLADRCVVLPGTLLKKGCVLGSGSLAAENFVGSVGSMWVGSRNGSATLVSPEDPSIDKKDLVSPFGKAFYQKECSYCVIPLWMIVLYNTFWQGFCVCYHNSPILLSLYLAYMYTHSTYVNPDTSLQLELSSDSLSLFRLSMIVFIPVYIFLSILALIFDIVTKWILIGRRKQGEYSWNMSSYCQRWQLHLTLQQIRRGERENTGTLELICGSQYLVWYFRALGCQIGENVCLYPNGGDPMMTEPDLVTIGDNSCVDNASLIAHINTRGIFKLNPIIIGSNCVLKSNTRILSGSGMEDYSILLEHTLVISGEVVEEGMVWQGWPSLLHYPLREHREGLTHLLSTSSNLDLFSIFLSTNSTSSLTSLRRKKKRQLMEREREKREKEKDRVTTSSTQTFFDRFLKGNEKRYHILETDTDAEDSIHPKFDGLSRNV